MDGDQGGPGTDGAEINLGPLWAVFGEDRHSAPPTHPEGPDPSEYLLDPIIRLGKGDPLQATLRGNGLKGDFLPEPIHGLQE